MFCIEDNADTCFECRLIMILMKYLLYETVSAIILNTEMIDSFFSLYVSMAVSFQNFNPYKKILSALGHFFCVACQFMGSLFRKVIKLLNMQNRLQVI